MTKKNLIKSLFLISGVTIMLLSIKNDALALPTFQVYIDGATAGSLGGDEETWFSNANPFDLFVVGAYGPNTTGIDYVTLLLSVPEGETGTITFSTLGDGTPTLLTLSGTNPANPANPIGNADTDILTGVGSDGYSDIVDFLPSDLNLNNHYPLQDDVSDFLIYNLGSFSNAEEGLINYNASDGTTDPTNADGEQKEYSVTYTGFSKLHLDVYGLVTTETGGVKNRTINTTWDNNPGSHDSTTNTIPEPATLSLLGLGLLGLVGMRKKKAIS